MCVSATADKRLAFVGINTGESCTVSSNEFFSFIYAVD